MVLNGTSCSLNKAVFASNFWLPYSTTMTRLLHYGYQYVDMDIGECFLNYPLYPNLVNYSALDLTCFCDEISKEWPEQAHTSVGHILAVWSWTWFGF